MNITQHFLQLLSGKITPSELDLLSHEAGFLPPVSFNFHRIQNILEQHTFPKNDHIEYCWALAECGLFRFYEFGNEIRIFVSSIYTYCNAIEPLGTRLESDFFWMGVEGVLRSRDAELTSAAVEFFTMLERTHEGCSEEHRYFCLLSICFLQTGNMHTIDEHLIDRIAILKSLANSKNDLDFTDSVRGLNPWRAYLTKMADGENIHRLLLSVLPIA